MKALLGDDTPRVLKGFDVIDPQDAIGTQNVSIRIADSVVFYPGSNAGPFFHGLPEGNENAQPLVPELRKNATNYVYCTLTTFDTSRDTRAFWDPDLDGGDGGEFTQDINTESVLTVDINVSTSAFPENTIPIAIVKVGAAVIESIEDARDMMFRLGAGGLNPDPFSRYTFPNDPSSTYARKEPPTEMSSALDPNPFQGADKNIENLKEWMDAVMTKLAELGGTTFWYQDASTFSLVNLFLDALGTSFRSKGSWEHNSGTPGLIAWTEDINVKNIPDPREIIIRQGNKTLANDEVMYIELEREEPINSGNVSVDWFNGLNFVNGQIGAFENLTKGDWVKKSSDDNDFYLRVEEFYAETSLTGGVTSPALAKSIKLSANYLGVNETERGLYSKGVYLDSEVSVSNRGSQTLAGLGGNLLWLATRQDTIQDVSDITTTALNSIDITEADGTTAKVTATGHGLSDGERVTIANSVAGYNGTYVVEVEDADTFYINTTDNGDELGVANAYYAVVTTTARSTDDGLQLESANHGFDSNDTVIIADTSSAFDGSYKITVRGNTTFQIAVGSNIASVSDGSATLAKINVRSEFGNVTIVQGESTGIANDDIDTVRQFIGMASSSETSPSYNIPVSYNTLDGQQNYNGETDDNLTVRVSKLTAMMADKTQDKTIKLLPSGYQSVTNTTNGSAQEITFNATPSGTPRLDIALPSSANNGDVGLTGTLSLEANEAAYIQIDRNDAFNFANLSTVSIAPIEDIPLEENTLVLAVRLGGSDVWLWDGFFVSSGTSPVPNYLSSIVVQNRNLKLVRGGSWSWDTVTGNLVLSTDAYIQVSDLVEARNTIAAQTINLPSDGDVAYVEINRAGSTPTNLTVNVTSIDSLAATLDTVIIARRLDDSILIGSSSMILNHGDSKKLDADDKIERVKLVDLVNSTLPTGTGATIDGVSVANGDRVLFTNPALNGIYTVSGVGSSLSWTKLDAFGGGTTPAEGAMVVVQQGSSYFNTYWGFLGNTWVPQNYAQVTSDPTGFPNRTDTTLSFNDGTRTFTISPTGTSFDIFQNGRVSRFNTAQTLVTPDVEGLHFIYFDNGTLTSQAGFNLSLITDKVLVAFIYWDAINSVAVTINDARHGLKMDNATHAYLHQSFGTRWITGLSAGNLTTSGDGSLDSDAQLSISSGTILNEDITVEIVDAAAPSDLFEQVLSPIAEIPVYFRDGVGGNWRKTTSNQFPLKVGTLPQWNDPSGPWTQVNTTDGSHIAMWIVATSDINEPVVAIMGQREDALLADALTNNQFEFLSLGNLPVEDIKVLYRLIFVVDSTFTNSVNAALRDVQDLRTAIDSAISAFSQTDHQLLSNRNAPGAHNATAISVDTSGYVGGLETSEDTSQEIAEALDKFFAQLRLKPHPSNPQRAIITGSDVTLASGNTLVQVLGDLIINFNGAEIDFNTGSVFESDGTTPLGINFTPQTIPVGEYFWYGVSLIPQALTSDNRQLCQVQVDFASATNATQANAPKPIISGDIKLGSVQVQDTGSIDVVDVLQLGIGSSSGSGGGGLVKTKLRDNTSTTLPSGSAASIDGVTVVDGDLVLFTNLSSGNNRIYKVSGVGSSLSWTAQRSFSGQLDPSDGDRVVIQEGDLFADQVAQYNGTIFEINNIVKHFNEDTDEYWEQGSLKSVEIKNELITSYDLEGASYDSKTFDPAEDTSPRNIRFNLDGTKAYVLGFSNGTVYQYTLSTPYDISTASYDSVSFSVAGQNANPVNINFEYTTASVNRMYIVDFGGTIHQYTLNPAFDLSTATYNTVFFSTTSETSQPTSVIFNSDGSKMYILGGNTVYQYSLSSNFDVNSATYDTVSFSVSTQDSSAVDIIFNDDGSKLYMIGANTDTVYQYTLSTPYDISTASYDSVSFSVTAQATVPLNFNIDNDGTKMYVADNSTGQFYQYSISQEFDNIIFSVPVRTTFDLSTASYDSVSFSVATQDGTPTGIEFNNDGTKMYVVGIDSDSVHQYTLSTAFNLSTASYDSVSFSVATEDTVPRDLAFNNDGTKMFILGDNSDSIYQYTLSTPYDISTASYDSVSFSVATEDTVPRGFVFNNDGTKMHIMGNNSDSIYQYTLSTAFNLSTASYDSVSFSVATEDTIPIKIDFNNDGTKMFMMGHGTDSVHQYTLSTAFDLSTASYDSVSFSVAGEDGTPTGITFNNDGTKMYVVGIDSDSVHQYSITNAIGNENNKLDYSVKRGTSKEMGTMWLTTNSTDAEFVAVGPPSIGDIGVDFSVDIEGTDLVLKYTPEDQGQAGTMKYSVKKWND